MDEEELKVAIEKEFTKKTKELTEDAEKKKIDFLTSQIASIKTSIFNKKQILEQVQNSIDFCKQLKRSYKTYSDNRYQQAQMAEGLIENLNLQKENLNNLFDLFNIVSAELQATGKNEALAIPLVRSNITAILNELKLTQDQMILLSIHLGDQSQVAEVMTNISELLQQLDLSKAELQAQLESLDLKLKAKQHYLPGNE